MYPLCRELKQHSLAEWRAAREQEERQITAQLAEQQQLQKQVCIAATPAAVIGPAVILTTKNCVLTLLAGRNGCPDREAGCKQAEA